MHTERPAKPLIDQAGCVIGVAFRPRSGARPDVVEISTRISGKRRATGLSVEGADFRHVYERAIHMLADMHGIDTNDPVRARLLDTRLDFMKKYGLTTQTVCYEQVVRVSENPAELV